MAASVGVSMVDYDYIREGDTTYERSFVIISAEAGLSHFSDIEAEVAIRMIHACGMVEASGQVVFSETFVSAARSALQVGAPILCDSEMVARGVTHARLPASNEVICTLHGRQTAVIAREIDNTRSVAAMHLRAERTALSHLLEMLRDSEPRPAAIIGMPVGFAGAAEANYALAEQSYCVPYAIACSRLGGSAMIGAAINALARGSL